MVQQGQIDHLLQEAGEIPPPPHVVEQATMATIQPPAGQRRWEPTQAPAQECIPRRLH